MPWGFAAAAVGTVASGALQADAAGSAADAQSQANAASIAEQRRQYDLTRQDYAPFLRNGTAANNQLAYLLGVGGAANGKGGGTFTTSDLGNTTGAWTPNQTLYSTSPEYRQAWDKFMADHTAMYGSGPDSNLGSISSNLQNELASRGFDLNAYNQQSQQNTASDPLYGSLLKKFDANDLANDVVYQSGLKFGLDQGNNAINQRALQSGSYDSGGTLKALTQYANDYGSTKANDAYNRYNTTNDSIYNKLAGLSGSGQTATGQVASAGTNSANNISSLLSDQGNSRSAGIIGGANAWGNTASGLNNIYNNYNSNSILKSLLGGANNGTYGMYGSRGNYSSSDFLSPDGSY